MTKRLDYDFVKTEFEKRGYILISKEYINAKSHLEYMCDKGHLNKMAYGHFKSGKNCPNCVGGIRLSYDFIKSEFEKRGWILLSKNYKNSSSYLDGVCSNGHTVKTSWDNFKSGSGCSKCINKRESLIGDILTSLQLPHNTQQSFDECRNKNPLRFDFGVKLSMNDWVLIEYNGIQHYKEVAFFGGKEKFEYLQKCDKIKKDFCKKVNYKLIELDGRLSDDELINILFSELGGYNGIFTNCTDFIKSLHVC